MCILDLSTRVGANNPNWKGGTTISKGYEMVRIDGHPRAWKHGKYVYKHIDVWEKEHNACLCKWGNVDHKDNNKLNNDPSNLVAMMGSQHTRRHKKGIQVKDMSNRSCLKCGSNMTYIDKKGRPHWYHYNEGVICMKCRDARRWSNNHVEEEISLV